MKIVNEFIVKALEYKYKKTIQRTSVLIVKDFIQYTYYLCSNFHLNYYMLLVCTYVRLCIEGTGQINSLQHKL